MNDDTILSLVKIGGNVIDNESSLKLFLEKFARIPSPKILIHGGGKSATTLAERLNVAQKMIQGRRVTDAETLKITTMVYAGWINKKITAQLNALGCSSFGLSGVDAQLISSEKRSGSETDFGFVGDPKRIATGKIHSLLSLFGCLVVAPVTSDESGQILNTNADTIASVLSSSLSEMYRVRLIYCFEMEGVLLNNEVMETISVEEFSAMKQNGNVHGGMIPKLDNAFSALFNGTDVVLIGNSEKIDHLVNFENGSGTLLCK